MVCVPREGVSCRSNMQLSCERDGFFVAGFRAAGYMVRNTSTSALLINDPAPDVKFRGEASQTFTHAV